MKVYKRREFIQTTGLAAGALAFGCVPSVHGRRSPNILFVFADQLRSMDLGCYGSDQVRTPHIDRLAKEGVLFKNAISTAPVSGPFRGMLMTGNFPLKNGMVFTDHFLRNPAPYFAQVCKAQGYQTGYIGKWHLDGYGRTAYIPPERRLGFDYWRALECTHDYFRSKYYHQDEEEPRIWPDYDAISQTREACQFIEDLKGNDPFCLFISWGPPHDPYIAPQQYMERFPVDAIRLRENVRDYEAAERMKQESDTAIPSHFQSGRERFQDALSRETGDAEIRKWYSGYFAAIETLDNCMGELIAALEKSGQLDDTIIVFTSDHGDNLGSHRQYGKQLPYEESISIPFIVRYPEKIKAGTKTEALLAPQDMMPTVLSLAGIPCHEVDGKDISGAAMGRDRDIQDAVLIMKSVWLSTNWITNGNGPWRGVRTKRHTYARKSDSLKPWMLFDNEADPQQMNNLVDDPAYAGLLKELEKKTDALLEEAGDPENPVYYAKLIDRERLEHGLHSRHSELLPVYIDPGSGFKS